MVENYFKNWLKFKSYHPHPLLADPPSGDCTAAPIASIAPLGQGRGSAAICWGEARPPVAGREGSPRNRCTPSANFRNWWHVSCDLESGGRGGGGGKVRGWAPDAHSGALGRLCRALVHPMREVHWSSCSRPLFGGCH